MKIYLVGNFLPNIGFRLELQPGSILDQPRVIIDEDRTAVSFSLGDSALHALAVRVDHKRWK